MFPRIFSGVILVLYFTSAFPQEKFTLLKDLRSEWLSADEGSYAPVGDMPLTGLSTIYFQLNPVSHAEEYLRIKSYNTYFLFVNGRVHGSFSGQSTFRVDSLLQGYRRPVWIAIHQERINERDLTTEILTRKPLILQSDDARAPRPYSPFRDFVVIAGLVITLLFLAAARINPKLAADYFAVSRIFTSREMDDSQASARLTGGSNVQFYVLCSLMIAYYLIIILQYLPPQYSLPVRFQVTGFWVAWAQWLKLSAAVFLALLAKVFVIFALTRLFNMRGMARFHFFNWIRLLLVVVGSATTILFMYFISHGVHPGHYVVFLSVIVAVLIGWIAVAFFKLSGRTGHSMFHLFSYLCATEIIPLLITVKVLFQ